MKQFLLLLHEDIQKMNELSPKQMQEIANAHMTWAGKLAEAGHLISGDGLQDGGVFIRGKDCIVKDGSYLESKEIIGGYYLLQGDSLETILELAKDCPTHHFGGTTEVRSIMDMEVYG